MYRVLRELLGNGSICEEPRRKIASFLINVENGKGLYGSKALPRLLLVPAARLFVD